MKLKYIAVATSVLALGAIVLWYFENQRVKAIDEKITDINEALEKLKEV